MPVIGVAQNTGGINFDNQLSWSQLLEKANSESKFLFVDCYTTWCGPCKSMERDVYPAREVGTLFNTSFISVKIQMDTSKNDDAYIRSRYADAAYLQKKYNIYSFPTFLFFSPGGQLVHKEVGACNPAQFVQTGNNALDSTKQYYSLLNRYKRGIRDTAQLLLLAVTARRLEDKQVSDDIAKEYLDKIVSNYSDEELCTPERLAFIFAFPELLYKTGSEGRYFKLLYSKGDRIDKMMKSDISGFYVANIILKEEIYDNIMKNDKPVPHTPDWDGMRKNIERKYNVHYADTLLPAAQMVYYKMKKDWTSFAKLKDEMIRKYPPKKGGGVDGDAWRLNDDAWTIFIGCDKKNVIASAIEWVDISISLEPTDFQVVDTKANLLFKYGKVREAIETEKKAIRMAAEIKQEHYVKEYTEVLEKMQKKIPTWPVK
ncbi:thioredoxin family protein [Chitinophaga solisilvae]|uniref:thioredoxin family protein n=1 Tax=Chitinophaga solisilvae TaxID=1233460 RepID=UPI00137063BB|nr:thioredoxin family protein [Chitinophaga solisilvae]